MTTAAIKREAIPTWLLAVAAVVVTVVAVLAFSISSAMRANHEVSYVASDQYLIDQAEASVREKLKDPASAVFSQQRVIGSGPDRRVCGLVNAKNSFGGFVGNERFVSFLGALAYIGDEKPPAAIWARSEHPCDIF